MQKKGRSHLLASVLRNRHLLHFDEVISHSELVSLLAKALDGLPGDFMRPTRARRSPFKPPEVMVHAERACR